MFPFFKKKEAKAAPAAEIPADSTPRSDALSLQLSELCGPFQTEEFDLSAVTGPMNFSALPRTDENPDGPWLAVLPLTAWSEGDDPVVRGKARLYATADTKLLTHLRRMAPRDSMIQVRVKKNFEGNAYLMQGLPSPIMDPELKAILLEQVKEVSMDVDGLGHFILDRSTGFYLGDVEWLGQELPMSFPQTPEAEGMTAAQELGRSLLSDAERWNEQAMQAAQDAFRFAYPEDEGESPVFEITSIDLGHDGTFCFWFGNEELPEPLCAQGSVSEGFFPADTQTLE